MPVTEIESQSAPQPKFDVELLNKDHDKTGFRCEEESLTGFLLSFAGQHSKRDISKTYVAVESGKKKVLGYFTLVNSSLSLQILPSTKGYPKNYDVPAIKLARLARDINLKGTDIGEFLLMSVFDIVVQIADKSGAAVLELDAMNVDVKEKFYAKHGFEPLLDNDLHLYLPVSTIRKIVSS